MKLFHRLKSAQNNPTRLNHPSLIYQNKRYNITKLDYATQPGNNDQLDQQRVTRETPSNESSRRPGFDVIDRPSTASPIILSPDFALTAPFPRKSFVAPLTDRRGSFRETVSVRRRFVAARNGLLRSSSMRHCRRNNSGIIDQVG